MSQQLRPHERWGQESFRRRSVICDINESVTDAAAISAEATGLSVDEISASGTNATPPSSSRTEALKRLRLAASTIILTNDLKIEHNDEARKRLNRAANTIIMTNNLLLLQRSKASLTSKESSIEEETPAPPITSHPRNAGQYTVVAFVNSASGGGMGNVIFKSLQDLLGPSFVIDLHSCRPGNMPEDSLLKYAYDPMVRVLACGGDGTCGWILSCLDKVWSIVLESEQSSSQRHANLLKYKDHLPLAIMPLGTGNDLSRQFGWGGTFQPHMKKKSMIASVQRSKLTSLDIWRCIIMPVEKLAEEEKQLIPEILGESYKDSERESSMNSFKLLHSLLEPDESSEVSKRGMKVKENSATSVSSNDVYDGVLCNYFSLGFDATVAYRFHQEREAHPEKFTSPLKNKLVYVMNTPAALSSPRLKHRVKVLVNNENGELVHLKVPWSCRAIVSILNRYRFASFRCMSAFTTLIAHAVNFKCKTIPGPHEYPIVRWRESPILGRVSRGWSDRGHIRIQHCSCCLRLCLVASYAFCALQCCS